MEKKQWSSDPFESRASDYQKANLVMSDARTYERSAMLDLLEVKPGPIKVCDLQSASGYLASGLQSMIPKERLDLICVEPSKRLHSLLSKKYQSINCPLEAIPLDSATFDAIMCLAGTHHSESLSQIVTECFRLLKPHGQCIIAEGESNSKMALWLNGFVDEYTQEGHKGNFIQLGQLSKLYQEAGLIPVYENRISVPWQFDSYDELITFCKTLFGLSKVDRKTVENGVEEYLDIYKVNQKFFLDWSLIYSRALKGK